jgi:DNA-directed RNA polymerase subunit RPC12/RpoP
MDDQTCDWSMWCWEVLEHWKSQDHSPCPRCDAEHKDHLHMYQCLACSTKLEWHGAMNDLQQWCDLQETSCAIMVVILRFLKVWQAGWPLPPYCSHDVLAHAYDAQGVIG